MSMDAELELWSREWQSENAVPANLRKAVERQSRWMRIALAADILVTVGIGGAALLLAVRSPRPEYVLLAAVTWFFIAAAWTFSLLVNRGNWSPAALDTAAFVELSVRRCRSRLAAVWFGAALYLVEMAFCLGWLYRYAPRPWTPPWSWLAPATLLFSGGLVWYRRKKRAELAWLLTLRVGGR